MCIRDSSRRSVKSRIFSTLFVCRWLQGRSAILSRTEKRRTATGGVRRIDVYRQSGSTMDTCQDYGISDRRGCRIAGRLTNDICRYRRGKRYDQPVGHQRSTEAVSYTHLDGYKRQNLYCTVLTFPFCMAIT